MAVYPSHKSVLVVEPIDVTKEDIELLNMEENPLHVLQYFISTSSEPPKFKSKVCEDYVSNYEFDKDDLKQDAVVCYKSPEDKFLFLHLLKNTAWAASQLNLSKDTIKQYVDRGLLNGIKSLNKKYILIIPDDKFSKLLSERKNMNVSAPVPTKVVKIQDKVSSVIQSGAAGGIGSFVHAEKLLPLMAIAYPNETFTKAKINSSLATLLSHGEVIRVYLLDSNGNPTTRFAPGKYKINVKTAVDYPAVNHPVVNHPAPPVVNHPVNPPVSYPVNPPSYKNTSGITITITEMSQDKHKLAGRIAFEKYIQKHLKDGRLVFTIEEVARENPEVKKGLITTALNNARRSNFGSELLRNLSPGHWEYRNDKNLPWLDNVPPKTKTPNAITLEDVFHKMSHMIEVLSNR